MGQEKERSVSIKEIRMLIPEERNGVWADEKSGCPPSSHPLAICW